jgi:hypothetical protein
MKKFIALLALGLQLYPALCFSALSAQDLAHYRRHVCYDDVPTESGKQRGGLDSFGFGPCSYRK